MAEGWTPGSEGERLPRVEDLPVAQEGYDPGAVAAAFDAFYRHAAQLDATLAVLESVDTFRKEAGDLRADIRALRASAWGPLPGRQTWAAGYAVRASAQRGGFLDVAPRIAVEAAFIILVAVGAAIADLSTTTVVLIVVAAWLVVGLAEVLASLTRQPPPPPVLRPMPAQAEFEPEPLSVSVEVVDQEVVEEAPAEPARDPWESELPLEPEPELEPEPVAEEPEPEEQAEPEEPRRRFWRRRDEVEAEAPVDEAEPKPLLTDALQRAVTSDTADDTADDTAEDTGALPVAEEPEPDGRPLATPPQPATTGRTRRRGR